MARERVITGEAVEIELPLARLATRTAAAMIDGLIQLVFLAGFLIVAGMLMAEADVDVALGAAVITTIIVLVLVIWPVTFETVTRGRSPGKYALGLRVVRDDGGPIRFRHALVRGLVALAIECPGILLPPFTWALGVWSMLLNNNGKRVGDLAAGTMVLQERLPSRGRYVAVMPPALAPWAASLDLTRVSDDMALTARQFLSRAHELREAPRAALGQRLVEEISAVTTPPPPPGTSGWWFLAAVVAERRRRHEQRLAAQRQQYLHSANTGGVIAAYAAPSGPTVPVRPAPVQPVAPVPVNPIATPPSTTGFEPPI